jgi:hypothetical protein
MKHLNQVLVRWILAVAMCSALIACASSLTLGSYSSFGFDMGKDQQDAVVLNYRYGNDKYFTQAPEQIIKEGKGMYFQSMSNFQYRIDFLYVKWRSTTNGQVYEDKVDLHRSLPRDMNDQTVYFMIKGAQLYVYLIAPEKRLPGTPPIGPRMYASQKITTLYPDQSKP